MSTKTNTDKVLKLQQESSNTTDKENLNFKQIEKTPFTIVSEDDKVFAVMGKYRLTENYNSAEECEKAVTEITWNRLIQVMSIMINEDELIKKIKE